MSSREKLLFIQYEFKFGLYKKLSYINIKKKYTIYILYILLQSIKCYGLN